jgi:Tol biopolymer transport system component
VHSSGKLVASRFRSVSDIWRFPIDGSPAENTCNAVRITHQTGHVQTPSASPDDTEVVYISDSGGHGNLWVTRTDSASARQITFETDPAVSIGVPRWSPRGDEIAFVRSRSGRAGLWIVRPDGSAAHEVAFGWAPCWSADGHWLYYWWLGDGPKRLEKIPIDGGDPVFVREEPDISLPAPSPDGSTLYFIKPVSAEILGFGGRAPVELRRAQPETAPSELLGRFDGDRISGRPGRAVPHVSLSPDGRWLATSLVDRASSNLWIMSTEGGPMRPVTDFGQRSTIISRSVSWTADSRSIYAAVAETEIDIVLLAGVQLSGAV